MRLDSNERLNSAMVSALLQKFLIGTRDQKEEALSVLSTIPSLTWQNVDEALIQEVSDHLLSLLAGEGNPNINDAGTAAIALANLGDRSPEVAYAMIDILKTFVQHQELILYPPWEFLSSSSLLPMPHLMAHALGLFKGSAVVADELSGVILDCEDSPFFEDIRMQNVMRACLRALGMIGAEEGRPALEYWSLLDNTTAKAALDCFGRSWEDIVAREEAIGH
jgi:hypothetical protein